MTLSYRAQIPEATLRLFINRGIHATATLLIVKEAGNAAGHHFKCKRELAEKRFRSDDPEELRQHLIRNIRMTRTHFAEFQHKCTQEPIDTGFEIYWKGICHA